MHRDRGAGRLVWEPPACTVSCARDRCHSLPLWNIDLGAITLISRVKRQATQNFLWLIVIPLVAIAIGRIIHGILGALSPTGAWDFYAYWYHGHFFRPASHWAYPVAEFVEIPNSAPIAPLPAALTPPLMFLLSLFSYVPWPLAKFMWVTIIVSLVFAIPWLLLHLLPIKATITHRILIAILFYALTGTSFAIRTGQPTILVLFLILLTLLFVRRGGKVLPGIILGLALSKFSLTFPLLLFLLYKRRWYVVMIGLGVQILGFLALALLVQSPLQEVILNYRSFISTLAGSSNINLLHLAGHFPHSANEFIGIGLVFSILVFGALWWGVFRYKVKFPFPDLWDYTLFAFLNVWGLLVAFHRQYDSGASIFAIALLISAMSYPNLWGLSSFQVKALASLTAAGLIGVGVFPPALSYTPFLPIWAPIRWKMMTIGIVLLGLACFWLWRQGVRHSLTLPTSQGRAP